MTDSARNIRARLANVDEAAQIAAILHQAFVEYEPLYTPAGYSATTPTADQIRQRWNEGPVWVAFHDDGMVGTIAAVPKDHRLYIRSMAILPSARGLKIGKLLLDHVERFAIDGNFNRMFLSTTPFLLPAIRLYETYSFVKTGEGPHDLAGTPLFTMEKKLKPLKL